MALKTIKLHKLRFWQQWLLLTFLVWLGITVLQLVTYLYQTFLTGTYTKNADGTSVTLWRRLASYNFEQLIWLDITLFFFLAEANYRFVFRKMNTLMFGVTTLVCGFVFNVYIIAKAYIQIKPYTGLLMTLPAFLSVALIFYIYVLIRNYIYDSVHAAETRLEQSKAELNTLKAQVNPHFFFNTLNSLYGTALEESAPRTANSIEELAGIMRYTMNEAQQDFTPVANEIKFITDYLHLQRLRLPERPNIDIRTAISYDQKPATIAPMLLIPFIENAFKYGISIDYPCYVHIQLQVENLRLILKIENSVARKDTVAQGQGTGITNTKKRLDLLYPNRHQLKLTKSDNRFEASLQLELS
jgi:sensor histidine kinase YesM